MLWPNYDGAGRDVPKPQRQIVFGSWDWAILITFLYSNLFVVAFLEV